MNDEFGTMNEEKQKPWDLKERLKEYSLRIIALYCSLPQMPVAQVLGKQMLRSGTSPGAHHREASRARSTAEFISKMEGGLQELDETVYWLELLVGSKTVPQDELQGLFDETEELMAIFTASVLTAKKGNRHEIVLSPLIHPSSCFLLMNPFSLCLFIVHRSSFIVA